METSGKIRYVYTCIRTVLLSGPLWIYIVTGTKLWFVISISMIFVSEII